MGFHNLYRGYLTPLNQSGQLTGGHITDLKFVHLLFLNPTNSEKYGLTLWWPEGHFRFNIINRYSFQGFHSRQYAAGIGMQLGQVLLRKLQTRLFEKVGEGFLR